MGFKVGQKVVLIDRTGMNVLIGSTAIIKRIDKEFLYIAWITPQTQSDGAYYPFHFEPVIKKYQQLVFSFMRDG